MKHSQATSIALSMIVRDDSLIFSVSDNGKGFEKGSIRRASNGLKNMQSRMEEIGGTFEISTDPGTGTKVLYSMPLPG
ncbi:MAG: ATP-binding protein [Bacteroidota bacterium]